MYMYIIEVIPLSILPSNTPQLLSYFFNKKLEKGAVVEISLGNRRVCAIVVGSTPLEDQKISLKKSGFQLKKISNVISETPQISNVQFKIALWLSKYYYAPLGYCLKTVIPPFFLKKGCGLTIPLDKKDQRENIPPKPLFLLSGAKETLANLMPLIKKSVEELGQVALIIPDITTLQYFYENLSTNYEVTKIHSGLNNKKLYESWIKIKSGQTDIILGTRQALFVPFKNLKLLVIDDLLHEFYKSDMTPKYNTPNLAKMIANIYGAKIIFISPITGTEYYYHLKNKEYDLLDKIKTRESLKVINMIEEIKDGNFSMFSQEFKNRLLFLLNKTNQNNKILIFSPRRGHSGVLVCQNCHLAIKCQNCRTAYRVHKATELFLACHHCSRNIRIPENCPNCKSFKLKTVGPAGTQKIYEEVQKILMFNNIKVPVLILDTDVIKNDTEEEEVVQEIKNPRTSIIISTQMIFSHRYSWNFDLIGVLNADSIINIPDFQTEDRLFYQIEKLLDFLPADRPGQPKNIILQTYNPDNEAIMVAGQGNHQQFYEKELEIRKIFSYPPYSRLIKLSYKHKNQNRASYEARILNEKLKMVLVQLGLSQKIKIIDSHPSFIEKEGGCFVYNIVLKTLPTLENFHEILKFVPSNWFIDVDPRTVI